ncbi:MAG: sugar phosphate nucleotidyltransferase [Candidatus Omnitrophica bacterium]|nr:sugar phosphate nucleotidyltransferase [Candidatus Omnitrophota bacterium]
MKHAIILAGGIGSRFWPLSKETEPKQFLNIYSNKGMLEETIQRIRTLIKKENIYIATNKTHYRRIKKYLTKFDIPLKNALFEPESKNTLAPIGLLSKRINDMDPEAICLVLPSDHLVKNGNTFLKCLKGAINAAGKNYIVTLGIRPTRPETGYGYIKVDSELRTPSSQLYYEVEKFIEKPNLSKAKEFLKDKRYYWNSGIFIFKPRVMLEEIKRFKPDIYKLIMRLKDKRYFNRLWSKMPSVSVDYAIMEKTKKKLLLPADYGWVDLGSWQTVEEISRKDKDGNIFKGKGNFINIGSKNTIVWSNEGVVATLGLENIIIVNTKDALLVTAKDKTQDVKKVVQLLKQKVLRQKK